VSANLRMYTRLVFGFEHTIRQVAGRWHSATPCGDWDVRQVTGHTIAVVSNVAARAGIGELLDQFGDVAAIAGDDPVASFRAARDRYLLATDRPGALQVVVPSRLGRMTLDRYLAVMCCDTLVHTWDIATGLALPTDFEADALAFVRAEYAIRTVETMRGPDLYGAEIAVDTDDDLTAILAFTGRRSGS
jgi:uncharacterized protein (TIGR03086 family)